jgi:hypothetical protein
MSSLTNWCERSPFWEGAASAFDLLGVSGLSITDARRILSAKRRYNAIKENFDLVRKTLQFPRKYINQAQ